MLAEFLANHCRGSLALKMDQVRYILLVSGWCRFTCDAAALLPSPCDRDDKVGGGVPWRLAVEAAVQQEDFVSGPAGTGDGLAYPAEDERRGKRSVERSDAVDDGFRRLDCLQDFGVGYRVHLLAVRVDIPNSRDPGRQRSFGSFGKGNIW